MKLHTLIPVACAIVLAAGITGCAQTGVFGSASITTTELSDANFRIVATNVSGESEAGYLLGVSAPMGFTSTTVALARVQGTGLLYQEALADLWENFEREYGAVKGRTLALVNVRYDSDNLNLLLYTSAKVSIRADVVEFIAE